MGARANYVVIKDGKTLAFYDHWGAPGVVSLFGGGPKQCSEMAEDCQPVLTLLDDTWGEGGLLVDWDRKVGLFFGSFDLPSQGDVPPDAWEELAAESAILDQGEEAWMAHIAPRWEGWTIRWVRGQGDLLAYLEERRLKVYSPFAPDA